MLVIASSSVHAVTYWTDDFETDKGWTFTGNAQQTWVRGTPVGGSGVGPDPVGAYQGTYCIGNNMTAIGNYQYASSESSFAVSPAINCTGTGSVYIHFYRWLCTKGSSNTTCSLTVSNNGTTWTGVWGNPNPAIGDAAWQYVSYDITAVASNQPAVYLRFRLKDSGAAPPRHGGWNIDNIVVDNAPLAVSLSSFTCSVRGDAIQLSWRTESETDCYLWVIERSTDPAGGYLPLGTIPGRGTTSDPHSYAFTDASLEQPGIYHYRLTEVAASGWQTTYGPVTVTYHKPAISAFQAGPAYPNPARSEAGISYQLSQPGRVSATIYNITGQRVRAYPSSDHPSGSHLLHWDGRDDHGTAVPGGIYYVRFTPDDRRDGRAAVVKLVLVR